VKLVFTVVRRKDLRNIVGIINAVCPGAFFSVEDVRTAQAGIFPSHPSERQGK
jgi:hypothetical protein